MSTTKVPDALRDVTVVDAAKITTGTIPEARITTLASTKLTGTVADARFPATLPASSGANLTALPAANLTGTIADARIPASAVTQHVTATDLTAVHQAIATLGLHTAVSDNKAAFNLPNAFIDTFEDDTGIATETTVDRNASEYVSSVYTAAGTETEWDYTATSVPFYGFGTSLSQGVSPISSTNATSMYNDAPGSQYLLWTSPSSSYATGFYADYGADYSWTKIGIGKANVYADITNLKVLYSTSATGTSSWTPMDWTGVTYGSNYGNSAGTPIPSGFLANGSFDWASPSNGDKATAYYFEDFPAFTARYLRFEIGTWAAAANSNVGFSNLQPYYTPDVSVANATGTLVSTVQTAPVATTTLSGVILYTDEFGTNTLGSGASDNLAIYLTANLQGSSPSWIGTNWTDVGDTVGDGGGYGTPQTFSGTTKQVKLGKTTVTSGTQVAMKAVWANQVASTTVAQLNGWAVNY